MEPCLGQPMQYVQHGQAKKAKPASQTLGNNSKRHQYFQERHCVVKHSNYELKKHIHVDGPGLKKCIALAVTFTHKLGQQCLCLYLTANASQIC